MVMFVCVHSLRYTEGLCLLTCPSYLGGFCIWVPHADLSVQIHHYHSKIWLPTLHLTFKKILVNCIKLWWKTRLQNKDASLSYCSYLPERFTMHNFYYQRLYLDYSTSEFKKIGVIWKQLSTILISSGFTTF